MTYFILGTILALILFVIFGFKKDGKGYTWAVNAKQFIALLGILVMAASCVAKVPTGHTGVVTTFGHVEDYTYEAGIHLKNPLSNVINMDNRTQKETLELSCFSSDIQEVNITYTVNFQIDKENAQTIYKTIGEKYYDKIIIPRIQDSVKTVAAKFTAENLVGSRNDLSEQIETVLKESLAEHNIQLVGSSVENMDFTDAFTEAVEAKQVAEQNKLKAQTEAQQKVIEAEAAAQVKVIEAQAEADAILAKATAEAEANQKLAASITDELIDYQYAEKWDGELPQITGGDSVIPVLDGFGEDEDNGEN
ncbi:MAG: prohibitin family protein [Clostridia bacterium]|nr:prohibitin family protein [Clostridia bacterium]